MKNQNKEKQWLDKINALSQKTSDSVISPYNIKTLIKISSVVLISILLALTIVFLIVFYC